MSSVAPARSAARNASSRASRTSSRVGSCNNPPAGRSGSAGAHPPRVGSVSTWYSSPASSGRKPSRGWAAHCDPITRARRCAGGRSSAQNGAPDGRRAFDRARRSTGGVETLAHIVLVHGIAQELRSAADLEAEWLPSLAGGLENAGHEDLADRLHREAGAPAGAVTVRMAFYGNRFRVPDQQGVQPEELNADEELVAEEVALDLLRNATRSAHPRDAAEAQRAVATLTRDPGDAQGAPRRLAGRAVAALDRIPWFTRGGLAGLALASRTLAQVTRYLTDSTIRDHAIGQLTARLTPDTRAVVGHSLGSVVAYEALRARRAEEGLPLLITLGSPLGLSAINRRLRQPPAYPAAVRRWVNLAAPDDVVAARPDLLPAFDHHRPAGAELDRTWDCLL